MQFSMSTQFISQKQFYFKFIQTVLIYLIQFSISTDLVYKNSSILNNSV